MEPTHASLAQAKVALIDAARALDPLAQMRRRPFVSVGVAAGIGAVLGMNPHRLIPPANLTRVISSIVRLVTSAVGTYVASRANHAETELHKEPA